MTDVWIVLVLLAFRAGGQIMSVHGCDIFGKKMELKPLQTKAEKQENIDIGIAVPENYRENL
jgi:hypothetical protein